MLEQSKNISQARASAGPRASRPQKKEPSTTKITKDTKKNKWFTDQPRPFLGALGELGG
jgi:hypothetical protein